MSLVWMFQEHRDLYERSLQQARVIAELEQTIAQLEQQLIDRPVQNPMDALAEFQDKILVDQPFEGGKVPDHYWLTPAPEAE